MLSEASTETSPVPQPKWGTIAAILVVIMAHLISILVVITLGGSIGGILTSLYPGIELSTNLIYNFLLLFITDLSLVAVILGYVLVVGSRLIDLGLHKFKLNKLLWALPAFLVYGVMLLSVFMILPIIFPQIDLDQVQKLPFTSAKETHELVIAGLALLVVAPIAEEVVFRGFLFGGMRRRLGWMGAAMVSSILFGLVHLQLNVGIDTFLLGLALAWVYQKTDSIWPAVALHMLKNGVAFYFLFLTELV